MGKFITIAPKEPNAHSVRGGYFPLPLQRVGPSTWHNIMSADWGVNPIDGTKLVKPTFDQVLELAGDALTDRYNHKKDGKFNPAFDPVVDAMGGVGKVLTGDTLMVVSPTKAYFVNNPNQELRAQFGVNDQRALEEMVSNFDKQLKRKERRTGIASAGNLAAVSVENVSQGDQSWHPMNTDYLGRNLGLIALARSREVAESLAVGSRAYKGESFFGLSAEANKLVTRVPGLVLNYISDNLAVVGYRDAGDSEACSLGISPVKTGN